MAKTLPHPIIPPCRPHRRHSRAGGNPVEQPPAIEKSSILRALEQTKTQLAREYSPAAWNIGINDGPAAGQIVPHMHIHVIPRYQGDVPDPRGGIRWVIPEKAVYWKPGP